MYSACRCLLLLAAAFAGAGADLRVCADPGNLPYSDSNGAGFENELARMVSRELGRPLQYRWMPQREKFFKALAAGACDVAMEAPANFPPVRTTKPFYRSSYVFITRRDGAPPIRAFDDPRLKTLRIGVQVIASDTASAPAAGALAAHGIVRNVTWYRLYQNYLSANHPAVLLEAVERGDTDVAIAWGPTAGYFAKRAQTPLTISPISPRFERSGPFAFDISMAVRRDDAELATQLNSIIDRRAVEIRRILTRYGVPLVEGGR